MYYFVGWPSVLESYCKLDEIFAVCSSEDGETFIVCTSTDVVVFHIKFLCAIGHFSRSNTCLKENGLTSSAILRWDSSRILLCTEKGIVFIYAVEDLQFLYESLDSDSVPSPSMEIFSLIHTIRVSDCKCSVFSLGEFVVVASEKGDLIRIRWDGSYYGESVNLKSISSLRGDRNSEVQVYCKAIEWAPTFGGAFALFSSGHIALFVSFGSGENQTCIEKVLIENVGHPTCTAVNNRFRVLAVGTESSEVLLYKMDDTSGAIQIQHTLRISGRESSYATQNVGSVSEIIWSPDGYTLAVAWMQSGWSLWSVFGALLYTSLNEHVSQFSEMRISNMSWAYHGYNIVGLVTSNNLTGIAKVASTDSVEEEFTSKYASKVEGSLLFSDRLDYPAQKTSYLVVFHLARSSISANPTSDNHLHIVLQTADRIILVNRDQLTSRIQTQNITVPKPYINSNWPVRYVAVSTDGKRIAVSGRNGFIHYNCVSQRWHVFGNIKQENSLHVFGGLVWWKQYICLTCFTENYGSSEVRVYSSNHKLDNQFCSVRNLPLLTLPVIVDNFENLFLTLTNDGCLQIFSLSESLSSKSSVIISPFWTINLTNIVVFPACVVRICLTTLKGNVSVNHTTTSAGSYSSNNFDPGLYSIESLILNYSGDVFMLQRSAVNASPSNDSETSVQSSLQSLSFGTPVLVASEVEILWSTSCSTSFPSQVSNHHLPSPNGIDINVYAKDSLWLYSGAAGLSVWLPLPRVPNSLAFNFNYGSIRSDTSHKVSRDHVSSPVSNFDHRRIMLSFELGGDFYPLSICFGDDLLVGILNEFHYSWNKSIVHGRENTSSDVFELFPYGTLLIKIQVALHQIIRQLLKKNLGIHAYQMGLAYQHLPYFPRTLELLLYEVLEVEAASKVPTPDPLLPQVVSFIQEFPNSLEILANCSRKTDVTWWPHLFMTVGRKPKDLFELCLENNKLETAASYLILLQTSEPLTVSCECALTLFQASLQSLKWDLIRDLLRFLCAIDPTEYNSVDEHKTKKHCNKSNILHLSPYNHTNDLPNPDNDHLQSKITSEKSIHKIVWYGEMSKYRPTRVTLKLLDFASDQLEDFSGTIKVTSDSLMIDSPKSSSDLRTQLGQLLTKVAVDYFRQGYLKRASQLITNIPEIFNDGHLSCHTNALQTWLNKNVHNIQPVSNWPKVFVNLLEDFIFVETVTNSDEGIHIFSTSADGNLLDSSNIVQIGNTSFSTEPSVVNYDFLSTVSEDTLRQLKCLLNQLASANSDEWMCLISILCLDRDAFFRSVIIAVNCSVLSDSSQLKHESFCPDMTIMNHSRLEKLVANLSELKRWFYEKYPVYHHFLISCEPYIKEIFKKAHQISNDMIDPSMGSPLVISDSVKHGINENQIMKVKNPPASNICDIFEYSKEWHQLDVKQNCSMTSRVLEKDPGPLNNILLPAIDEAVVYFEHNLTNSSVLLNSSTNSHYTSLDNSSCSTPIILTNETAITNHWRSGCRDRWKPVNDFSLLGRLVVLNLDETDIRSGNEDLFDGTTENLVVNPPNPEQRGCLIM